MSISHIQDADALKILSAYNSGRSERFGGGYRIVFLYCHTKMLTLTAHRDLEDRSSVISFCDVKESDWVMSDYEALYRGISLKLTTDEVYTY